MTVPLSSLFYACCFGVAVVVVGGGCRSSGSSTAPAPRLGLEIHGDPASPGGATWSFRDKVDGVDYDLTGILMKPVGAGPFPAVLLSHGFDGSAELYGRAIGPTMVRWGLVVIATNYTHSSGVPIGAPGNARQPGASDANVLRAHMTYELLRTLAYVDMSRVAAHGHSMGAYVNAALLGAHPADFRVASSTGGGVRPSSIVAGPAPSPSMAATIRTPYQIHHGGADTVVPLSYDQRFDALLTADGVLHEFYVYPGADHLAVRLNTVMLQRVREWYSARGLF